MGIDDLIPDNKQKSGSESSNTQPSFEVESDTGKTGTSKYLETENWREIIEVVENEMNMNFNDVMSMPNQKQEEILHKAERINAGYGTWTGSEFEIQQRCVVCGHECKDDGVIIEDRPVCKGHSAAEVRTALDEYD